MLETVKHMILEHDLIRRGQIVLCGVSGGADSVALLHCLCALSQDMGFVVRAAHLNHRIRGMEADEDQRFVTDLCHRLGVLLYTQEKDVPSLAKRRRKGLEQAARDARYDFFERARIYFNADRIAVAHQREDQAETVLLHLIRGSGLTGVSGMRPIRGRIIRPLLGVSRAQILEYLSQNHQPYRQDSTNLLRDASRNRLRLDVLPYLQTYINEDVTGALCSAAELAARDEDYLCSQAKEALEQARRGGAYDRKTLAALPLPIKTRALRLALAEGGVKTDIERVHIQMLCDLLEARTGAQIILPGIEAVASYELMYLGRRPRLEPFEMPLNLPGETRTPRGVFRAMIVEGCNLFTRDPMVGCMDLDRLPERLVLRPRANGDRFRPIGAPGDRKIKDVFIDRKIPRFERELPLLCSNARVLFLPGIGVDDSVRVTEETRRVLWLEYTAG